VPLDFKDLTLAAVAGEPVRREDSPRKSRVLVVMAHGVGLCLYCEPGIVLDYIHETYGFLPEDGFPLDKGGVDYDAALPNGVYYGVLSLVDDGPGDWPGSREVCPTLKDTRLATPEEWQAHLTDEIPWDPTQRVP